MENLKLALKKLKPLLSKREFIRVKNNVAYFELVEQVGICNNETLIEIKNIEVANGSYIYYKSKQTLEKTVNELKDNYAQPKILTGNQEDIKINLQFLKENNKMLNHEHLLFVNENKKLIVSDSHILISEENLSEFKNTNVKVNASLFKFIQANKIENITITDKSEIVVESENIKIQTLEYYTGVNIHSLLSKQYTTINEIDIQNIKFVENSDEAIIDNDNDLIIRVSKKLLEIILKQNKSNAIKIETIENSGYIKQPLKINNKILLMPLKENKQ